HVHEDDALICEAHMGVDKVGINPVPCIGTGIPLRVKSRIHGHVADTKMVPVILDFGNVLVLSVPLRRRRHHEWLGAVLLFAGTAMCVEVEEAVSLNGSQRT